MLASSTLKSLMRRMVPRRGSPTPGGGTEPTGASPARQADLVLWILGGVVLVSLVGFIGYYYYDRYYHPDEKLLDREAQHMEAMVLKEPQNADLRVTIAAYYLEKGLIDLAVQQSEEALKIDPKHQGALTVLGHAYDKKGDLDRAIVSYQTVIDFNKDNHLAEIDPRLEGLYYELGKLYDRQGKRDEAVAALKQALEIDRSDADARYLLATLYQKQNDHEGAVRELNEALRFDPFFADAYQALGASYTALGKAPEAAYAQGMMALSSNKFSDAAIQLEAVTQGSPDIVQAYFGLGLAYEQLGKRDQAIASLQKYLAANPDDIAANQAMGRLSRGSGQ